MPIEIRRGRDSERKEFFETLGTAFSTDRITEENARFDDILESDRTIVAMDGGRMVGATGTFTFRMTIPGAESEAGGVTMVGVLPTHRRRGVLRAMMEEQFRDSRSHGEPITILWASEDAIYTNFGYGMATRQAAIDIERAYTTFRAPPVANVQASLLNQEEALKVFPDIHERMRTSIPGMFQRSPEWWKDHTLFDREDLRDGASPMFHALLEIDGEPEGYAVYRAKQEWPEGIASGTLEVLEEGAVSPQGRIEVWRFLFGIDLMGRFVSYFLPIDHPLIWSLREPRRLRLRVRDALWLRVIDLPEALTRRRYSTDGRLVLEIDDTMLEQNDGRWSVEVRDGVATVERTSDDADLSLNVEELGSTYLGGISFTELAGAGRVEENSQGALRRADAMWHWTPAPWCPEIF